MYVCAYSYMPACKYPRVRMWMCRVLRGSTRGRALACAVRMKALYACMCAYIYTLYIYITMTACIILVYRKDMYLYGYLKRSQNKTFCFSFFNTLKCVTAKKIDRIVDLFAIFYTKYMCAPLPEKYWFYIHNYWYQSWFLLKLVWIILETVKNIEFFALNFWRPKYVLWRRVIATIQS